MEGDLNMGNFRLTGLGEPQEDTDAVSKAYLDANGGSTSFTLLWQNASPTSAFAAQKVSLDLSGYDMVFINFLTHCASGSFRWYHRSEISHIGNYHKVVGFCETGTDIGFRCFSTADDGINFTAAYYTTTFSSSSWSNSNNLYIPLNIYGIKGVVNGIEVATE
jgi:hypothetical protein